MDLINEFKKRVLEPLGDPVKVKESTLDALVATISKSESRRTGVATVEYHGSVRTPDYVPAGQYEVSTQLDHPDVDDSVYHAGVNLPLPRAEIDIHGYFPDSEVSRVDVDESAYIGWESTLSNEDFIKLVEWLVNHCADKSMESFKRSTEHIWEGDSPYCVLPEWVVEDSWDFAINLENFLDFVKGANAHGYHVAEVNDFIDFMNDFEPNLFWYRFNAIEVLREDREKKEKQFEDLTSMIERFLAFVKEELAKHAAETAKLLPFGWLDTQIEVIKSDFEPVVKPTLVQEPAAIEVREPPKERDTIRRLIEAGSDFLKNFFEVAFVYVDRDQNQPDRMLLTRIGSIEIPRLKAKTFQVKTVRGSVEKVASTLEGAYETTIEIRPDQNCYILDKFCEQAGVWEFENDAWIFPATSLFSNDQIGRGKRHRLDILVKEISGLEHETRYVDLHKSSLVSDRWGVAVNTPDVWLNKTYTSEWILEDVKIINVVDSIQYSFSSTDPSNISLRVLAKSVDHRVY